VCRVHLRCRLKETGEIILAIGILQRTLRNAFAACVEDLSVCSTDDMQYDRVVGVVEVVTVLGPIARGDVYLNIADPFLSVNADTRMAVIGSGVMIMLAYREYLDRFAIGGLLGKGCP
jgi:hypothetical protein